MFLRAPLLSIVLSNLAALASATPGPLQYRVTNKCPTSIDVHFVHPMGAPISLGSISKGNTVPGSQPYNSGFFYTTTNGGTPATGAGFHADRDGDSYYYYVVKEVDSFKAGINITPLDHLPNGGYCDAARCDEPSCAFAFSKPPTTFQRPSAGVPPTPPLYLCPFAKVDVTYEITFCPSGNWPSEPPPVQIHPNGDLSKCVHVRGESYANGTPVEISDCGPPLQSKKWLINRGTTQVRAAGNSTFCLDAGSFPANGVGMKIWQCYDNLAAQKWYYYSSNIASDNHDRIALVGRGQCVDLPDGHHWSGNRIQTWDCSPGNTNQVWTSSAK